MPNTIKVALIGQPNCGKSTFFNQLVGYRAQTSNFPGTTVELMKARVTYGGITYEITDLPGTYSLLGEELAERVTLNYLLNEEVDVIVNILDSSVLSRSLELTVELTTLQKPMILVLNMQDEAERKGLLIDVGKLSEILGIDVIPTVASQGKGVEKVIKAIPHAKVPKNLLSQVLTKLSIPELSEIQRKKEENELKTVGILNTILLLVDLSSDRGIMSEKERDALKIAFKTKLNLEDAWIFFHQEKHKLALDIFEATVKIVHKPAKKSLDYTLDSIIMNPYAGFFIALLLLFAIFWATQKIGGYLSEFFALPFDYLTQKVEGLKLSPVIQTLLKSIIDGLASGIGVVFPYFIPFVFLISLIEDIGYLARFAFVTNHLLHRIGLHGKSAVPLILGYGCNVPAIFSTRIIESERERLSTIFLIPFIPCSARLSIIFALSALFLGGKFSLILLILNILVVAVTGKIVNLFYKSELTDFILEIPPYRLPTLKGLINKVWVKTKDFIVFAWPVIIAGSVILAIIELLRMDTLINTAFSPFVQGLLKLPRELGLVLIFGILRKELALIMASQALHTPIPNLNSVMTIPQIAGFVTFVTFYTPCLSTILASWKEAGIKWTLMQIVTSLVVASILSVAIRFIPLF